LRSTRVMPWFVPRPMASVTLKKMVMKCGPLVDDRGYSPIPATLAIDDGDQINEVPRMNR